LAWATIVNIASERLTVKITFLGKDSTPNDSPTLFATDRDTLLVQGYKVTDPEALAAMRIPDNETVCRDTAGPDEIPAAGSDQATPVAGGAAAWRWRGSRLSCATAS
jgi:hypothetical protein